MPAKPFDESLPPTPAASPASLPVRFVDAAQDEVDFVVLSLYCSTHPTSIFARQRMLNRRTPDGSVSIAGSVFTRVTADGKERREIASDEEFRAVALNEFGIELP